MNEGHIEIPPLSEAYQKARRNYGFFSAILAAWELIGVNIIEIQAGAAKVTFKSPHAVPYILIVLVLYFSFRITNEWLQCHPMRRSNKASIFDFRVAHLLGATSIIIYGLQVFLELQIADTIASLLMTKINIKLLVYIFLGMLTYLAIRPTINELRINIKRPIIILNKRLIDIVGFLFIMGFIIHQQHQKGVLTLVLSVFIIGMLISALLSSDYRKKFEAN